MRKQVYWFFTFAFLVVGLAVAIYGFQRYRTARTSFDWPRVAGIIIASYVEESFTIDGGYFYKPCVEYEYDVDEADHYSERLTFGRTKFPDLEFAEYVAERYPVGGVVEVYYDPDNPANAVLEPGDATGLKVIAGTGVFMVVLSIIPIFRGIRYDPMKF